MNIILIYIRTILYESINTFSIQNKARCSEKIKICSRNIYDLCKVQTNF
jgi:hypothetical protein